MGDKFDELKDLIKQTMDKNGKLAQIKAQIKASVYNTIDNPDTKCNESQFYWENKKIQKLSQNKDGILALEVVKDFLEFYSLDYTNNVYSSEANVTQQVERKEIAEKCGILYNGQKPVLLQMVEAFVKQDFSGGIGGMSSSRDNNSNSNKHQSNNNIASKKNNYMNNTQSTFSTNNKQMGSTASTFNNQNNNNANKYSTDTYNPKNQNKDNNFEEIEEDDMGFDEIELDDEEEDDDKINKNKNNKNNSKKVNNNISDSYGRSYGGLQTSNEDIGLQSQGFDKSVDSLELEEYDYFEEAVKKKKR